MLGKESDETFVNRKDFLTLFVLLFNALSWFYMTRVLIVDALSDLSLTNDHSSIVFTAYSVTVIGSSVVGSVLSRKLRRGDFLFVWTAFGVFASLLPAMLGSLTVTAIMGIVVLLGTAFGLGMPSCLAYFSDHTPFESRGKVGGATLLLANLSAPLIALAFSLVSLQMKFLIFAAWRAMGLGVYFFKSEDKTISTTRENTSFRSVFQNRSFLLYFIPWLMFCLIDSVEVPILRPFFGEFYYSLFIIGPIIGSFSAFIAGLLSDRIGRKRVVLYGFVALGIAYAVLGITPTALSSWYFYLVIDSIASGMLWVAFVLILWGDLSQDGPREEYYAVGNTPFFLSDVVQFSLMAYVTAIPVFSAFSLASIFLFLAVLPLIYAPETLPKRKIELRILREYADKAKKIRERSSGESTENDNSRPDKQAG